MDTIVPLIYPGTNASTLIPGYYGISKEEFLFILNDMLNQSTNNFESLWFDSTKRIKTLEKGSDYYKLLKYANITISHITPGGLSNHESTIDYNVHSVNI